MVVDLAFFLDGTDEDLFWAELRRLEPTTELIDSEWTGNGYPVLAKSIREANNQHLFLWLPNGEDVFVRGVNSLFCIQFVRSTLRNGELLSGRLAVELTESSHRYEEFISNSVRALRGVAKPVLTTMSGKRKPRYLIGPSALNQASAGQIEGLRDRAVISLYLKVL
jgi:hypothetical protein